MSTIFGSELMMIAYTFGAGILLGLIIGQRHPHAVKPEELPRRPVPPTDLGGAFERMKKSDGERELLGLDPAGYRSLTGKEHPYRTAGVTIQWQHVKALTESAFLAGRVGNGAYEEWEKEHSK